jgi:hypothetical protein
LLATVRRLGPLLPQVATLFGIEIAEGAAAPKPLRPTRPGQGPAAKKPAPPRRPTTAPAPAAPEPAAAPAPVEAEIATAPATDDHTPEVAQVTEGAPVTEEAAVQDAPSEAAADE